MIIQLKRVKISNGNESCGHALYRKKANQTGEWTEEEEEEEEKREWTFTSLSLREESLDGIITTSLTMIHRCHIAARRIVSWRWCWCRCGVVLLIGLFDESGVHRLSNVTHFGDVWPLFRIENETSTDQMTKLNQRISINDRGETFERLLREKTYSQAKERSRVLRSCCAREEDWDFHRRMANEGRPSRSSKSLDQCFQEISPPIPHREYNRETKYPIESYSQDRVLGYVQVPCNI